MKIGRLTISDRATAGVYADRSGPEIEAALREVFPAAQFVTAPVPDEVELIAAAVTSPGYAPTGTAPPTAACGTRRRSSDT